MVKSYCRALLTLTLSASAFGCIPPDNEEPDTGSERAPDHGESMHEDIEGLSDDEYLSRPDSPMDPAPDRQIIETAPVGKLPGSLSIGLNGQANYSIPIVVPPGRSGMQPSLSFNYTSSASQGVMGKGWSLAGLSSITRCAKTIQDDSHAMAPALNRFTVYNARPEDDGICLDGDRLHEFDRDGPFIFYRPLRSPKVIVKARVQRFSEHSEFQTFEVFLPNGLRRIYGSTIESDGRVLAHPARGFTDITTQWLIVEEKDSFGNSMVFKYVDGSRPPQDGPRGYIEARYIDRIEYSTHSSAAFSATRAVEFHYDDLSDATSEEELRAVRKGFTSGFAWWTPSRLSTVRTFLRNSPVREYRVRYDNGSPSNASRVVGVRDCAFMPDGEGENAICRPETTFEWSGGQEVRPHVASIRSRLDETWDGRIDAMVTGSGILSTFPFQTLDLNGDGNTDLLYVRDGYLRARLGDSDPERALRYEVAPSLGPDSLVQSALEQQFFVVDLNRDGFDDVLFLEHDGENGVARPVVLESGFVEGHLRLTARYVPGPVFPVTGRFHQGGSPVDGLTYSGDSNAAPNTASSSHLLDINGDGLADLVSCLIDADQEWSTMPANAVPRYGLTTGSITGSYGEWVVNFGRPGGEFAERFVRTGASSRCAMNKTSSYGSFLADVSQDGLLDVVYFDTEEHTYRALARKRGYFREFGDSGFESIELNVGSELAFIKPVDLNGDGVHDLVGLRHLGEGGATFDALKRGVATGTWRPEVRLGNGDLTFRPAEDYPIHGWSDERTTMRALHTEIANSRSGYHTLNPWPMVGEDFDGDGRGDLYVRTHPREKMTGDAGDYPFMDDLGDKIVAWAGYSGESWVGGSDGVHIEHHAGLSHGISRSFWGRMEREPYVLALDANGDGALDRLSFGARYDYNGNVFNPESQGVFHPYYDHYLDFDASQETPFALQINERSKSERITRVQDGIGARHEVHYVSMADADVYTPSTDCEWPQRCDTSSRWVVSELHLDNGLGVDPRVLRYHYWDSRSSVIGGGSLGFARRSEFDVENKEWLVHHMNNSEGVASNPFQPGAKRYPFAGTPYQVVRLRQDESGQDAAEDRLRLVGSQTDTVFEALPVRGFLAHDYATHIVVPTSRKVSAYEETWRMVADPTQIDPFDVAELSPVRNARVEYHYDDVPSDPSEEEVAAIGLARRVVSTNGENQQTTTETEYRSPGRPYSDSAHQPYMVGRPALITLESDVPQTAADSTACLQQYETRFEYASFTGHLTASHRQEGGPVGEELRLEIERNVFGQATSMKAIDGAGRVRESRREFGDEYDSHFVTSEWNALDHKTRYEYVESLGLATMVQDPNEVSTHVQYDAFGRLRRLLSADDDDTTVEYIARDRGGMRVKTFTEGRGFSIAEIDRLGRTTQTRQRFFDPNAEEVFASSSVTFDAAGRIKSTNTPDLGVVTRHYDGIGALSETRRIDGVVLSRSWALPNQRFVASAEGRVFETHLDAAGRTRTVFESKPHEDAESPAMTYAYCADGRVRETIDPKGNTQETQYDRIGRRNRLIDPDHGVQIFAYAGFGELARVAEGVGTEEEFATTFDHDAIGRTISRTTPEGTTNFFFDTAEHGVGRLASAVAPNGVTHTYTFDNRSRLKRSVTSAFGHDYVFDTRYDDFARPERTYFPSKEGPRQFVQGDYSRDGETTRLASSSLGDIWELAAVNYRGQATLERFGNGFETERTYGSMTPWLKQVSTRKGDQVAQDWTYTRDLEGRIRTRTESSLTGDATTPFTERFDYDARSRLVRASSNEGDPLSFEYDELGNLTYASDDGRGARAFDDPAHPHRLTTFGFESQRYDALGRYLGDASARREMEYTSFHKPKRVTVTDDEGGPDRTLDIDYDAFDQRIRTVDSGKPAGEQERIHLGAYEVRGSQEVISLGFAELHRRGGAAWEARYLHRDALGSVDAITTEEDGVVARYAYGPYGKRRERSYTFELPDDHFDYGYTGHEHDDAFGLVNMDGRMYDPNMRVMTTPDPFVVGAAPSGFNRYAYVLGDPVNLIDPSGYDPEPGYELPEADRSAGTRDVPDSHGLQHYNNGACGVGDAPASCEQNNSTNSQGEAEVATNATNPSSAPAADFDSEPNVARGLAIATARQRGNANAAAAFGRGVPSADQAQAWTQPVIDEMYDSLAEGAGDILDWVGDRASHAPRGRVTFTRDIDLGDRIGEFRLSLDITVERRAGQTRINITGAVGFKSPPLVYGASVEGTISVQGALVLNKRNAESSRGSIRSATLNFGVAAGLLWELEIHPDVFRAFARVGVEATYQYMFDATRALESPAQFRLRRLGGYVEGGFSIGARGERRSSGSGSSHQDSMSVRAAWRERLNFVQ